MKTTSDAFKLIKNALEQGEPFAWLFALEFNRSDVPQLIRLTSNPEPVTWTTTDGDVYQPYPITFEQIEETSEANLSGTVLSVANVARQAGALLEYYDGLRDAVVRVRLVNLELLDDPLATVSWVFVVESATANAQQVTLKLAGPPLFSGTFPSDRYLRERCGFRFADKYCGWGYVDGVPGINPPAGVAASYDCDKTLDGANGCSYHGALYTAGGATAIHPKRFGGEPLIPR